MCAKSLRQMLESGETIVVPGAHDPLTARLLRDIGFKAVYVGGYQTGAQLATSEPLTTLTEFVEVAEKVIAAADDVAVLVDGGAGFGEPVHVMRTVKEFERIGAAGTHIEDQIFPKRVSYHRALVHVIPLEDFLDKLRFALKARKDRDFIIIGRTDVAKAVGGSREEAVRRAREMIKLGVDAVFISGYRTPEDAEYYRREIPDIPMMAVAGVEPLSVQDYRRLGYQIIVYSSTTVAVCARAVAEFYGPLLRTGEMPLPVEEIKKARELVERAIDLPAYYALEDETTEKRG
ncbi:MAG: isocitrate lyase/PEP mutase family protein [Chloroflexi bacterium]|nr:isocitrate lyase/PEP mutase family protein [Chloroflexota bacterium]